MNPTSAHDRKWRNRWHAVVKYGTYGALFAGGALVIAELVGPTIARNLGAAGGQGFGEGVIKAENAFASLDPNRRGRRVF